MPLTLQLTEGSELQIDVDLDEWRKAFETALRNDEAIEVHNPEGGVLAINPRQILYWTSETGETEEPPGTPEAALQ